MIRLISLFILFPIFLLSQDKIKENNFFDALSEQERYIIINKGTEIAFTGEYVDLFQEGLYVCKACNNPLYLSQSKFKSNCGWPSFDDEIKNSIISIPDTSYGMIRLEICCSNCKGHLGHVFKGEELTDKNVRHCVNSLSLKFILKQ